MASTTIISTVVETASEMAMATLTLATCKAAKCATAYIEIAAVARAARGCITTCGWGLSAKELPGLCSLVCLYQTFWSCMPDMLPIVQQAF